MNGPFQRTATSRPTLAARHGTSIVEVVLSTLLIGLVLVAALDAVGSALQATRTVSERVGGHALAHQLMAEVLAMPYEDADGTATVAFGIESDEPASPTNRTAFDDLDDYRNWSSAPKRRDGTALSNSTGWTRAVEIKKLVWGDTTTVLSDGAVDDGIRRVTVTVTSPAGEVTTLRAVRSRLGAIEQFPAVDTDVVTALTIELDTGGEVISHGVNLINHTTGP